MATGRVFFVGTTAEVWHHAEPFAETLQVEIVDPAEVAQVARPGDLALFYSEHFDRFRNAINQLKQRQVATLYLIDGILEWRNAWENRPDEPACPFTMRPVLCHKAACIGNSQARVLDSWGNAGKIEVIGIPRLDRLASALRHPRSDSDSFRLLVMTAKFPGFTPEQIEITERSLIDLKSWLDANRQILSTSGPRQIDVVWRLTAGLDREIGVENSLDDLTGKELIDQLVQVDAVISTPSTGMLEAMVLGLPVASLDYHQTPCYLPTAWAIHSADTIENTIRQLMEPPESKRLFQQLQLNDALAIAPCTGTGEPNQNDATATDRLITLVQQMLQIAKQQVEAGQSLNFPPQMLPQLESTMLSLQHRSVYPDFVEFTQNSVTELQVELAHSRREIQHLQSEIAQLQSELDMAHAIFDQIQKHPVAGPIVRLRQKFIDWFDSRRQLIAK